MCITTADTPRVEYTHEQAIADGKTAPRQPMRPVPDYYLITKGNTLKDELEEHFSTAAIADARADELNTRDVINARRLTKKQERRARRLHELSGPAWFSESFSWIRKEKRYAVLRYWDDGGSVWETVDTLAEVEEEIKDQNVDRVVDLDTGAEVPFSRTVTVSLTAVSSV